MSVVDLELTKFTLSVLEAAKQPMYYYNYYYYYLLTTLLLMIVLFLMFPQATAEANNLAAVATAKDQYYKNMEKVGQ